MKTYKTQRPIYTAKVAIVILNYNGRKHLQTFMPSVVKHCPEYGSIVVVDNCSTDDSVSYLQSTYPDIHLVHLRDNLGFAGGYYAALQDIDASYYLILNSDVELHSNSIDPMILFMDAHPMVGACQPKVLSYENRDQFEYAGACGGWIDVFRYPFCRGRLLHYTEVDNKQYDQNQKIFWSTGAAMLVRSEVYHAAGGFDTTFFAHMEEIDLCWRIQRMGYDIYCIPGAQVYHLGGGTLSYNSPKKTLLNFRNSLAAILKNEPLRNLPIVLMARLLLDGVAGIRFLLMGEFQNFVVILRAHMQFYGMIPQLLRKRKQFIENNGGAFTKKEKLDGILDKSVMIAIFLKGKRTYNQL